MAYNKSKMEVCKNFCELEKKKTKFSTVKEVGSKYETVKSEAQILKGTKSNFHMLRKNCAQMHKSWLLTLGNAPTPSEKRKRCINFHR